MALDPELARRVDPALSEIASKLDEASRLAADATLRLRDFGLPVPTQVSTAVAALRTTPTGLRASAARCRRDRIADQTRRAREETPWPPRAHRACMSR
jgi:hypothetical protein